MIRATGTIHQASDAAPPYLLQLPDVVYPSGLPFRVEEVVPRIVVDFDVGHANDKRPVGALGDFAEEQAESAGGEAAVHVALRPAGDGEGLAGAGLAVGEHGAVDPLERGHDRPASDALEHLILLRLGADDAVELERVVLGAVVHVPRAGVAGDGDGHPALGGVELEAVGRARHGPDADENADARGHGIAL